MSTKILKYRKTPAGAARALLAALLLLGLALPGFAGGRSEAPATPEPTPAAAPAPVEIVMSVPRTVSSLPFLLMDGFSAEGRTVKLQFFDDHALALAQLIDGQTQLLATGFNQGVAVNRRDPSLRLLNTPVWGVSALVAKDPQIRSLQDLKGRTVMVPFAGSPLEVQLKALLAAEGLTGQVTVAYAPIQQQPALLQQGQADAISVPEPLASRLVLLMGMHQVFTFAEAWARLNGGEARSPQVSFFVKDSSLPEAFLRAFVNRLREAVAQVKAEPAALAARYAETFALPEAVLARGLGQTLFDVLPAEAERALVNRSQALTGDAPLAAGVYALP